MQAIGPEARALALALAPEALALAPEALVLAPAALPFSSSAASLQPSLFPLAAPNHFQFSIKYATATMKTTVPAKKTPACALAAPSLTAPAATSASVSGVGSEFPRPAAGTIAVHGPMLSQSYECPFE